MGTLCWGLVPGDSRPLKNKAEVGKRAGMAPDAQLLPSSGVGGGPRGQGEVSLTRRASRAGIGSFGCSLGEALLVKEELTERAEQLVQAVQLLLFIPPWRRQWPERLQGLGELL